jgi:hypothetical protein
MFTKKFAVILSLVAFVFAASSASALTINGKQYDQILSVSSNHDFGYWPGPQKFFTFKNNDNHIVPIKVNKVNYKAAKLANVDVKEVFAMGTTAAKGNVVNSSLTTQLNSGTVSLYGKNDVLLLTATYAGSGTLDAIYKSGTKGQLDVSGLFNVTGGSLFTSGLVTGSLFIDIAFDNVWQNEYKDLKVRWGTFTFYQQATTGGTTTGGTTGGNTGTQIPEPASMSLLLSGVIATRLMRRKK